MQGKQHQRSRNTGHDCTRDQNAESSATYESTWRLLLLQAL